MHKPWQIKAEFKKTSGKIQDEKNVPKIPNQRYENQKKVAGIYSLF